MRTTPFPDIIRLTPAPGVSPGFTTPPGVEEIVGGEVATLLPLAIPPSVTDSYTKVTHMDLTDAEMAPTGQLGLYCMINNSSEIGRTKAHTQNKQHYQNYWL